MAICFYCMGDGYVECPECGGTGEKWPDSMNRGVLRGLDQRCDECGGSGRVRCEECDGSGYEE